MICSQCKWVDIVILRCLFGPRVSLHCLMNLVGVNSMIIEDLFS